MSRLLSYSVTYDSPSFLSSNAVFVIFCTVSLSFASCRCHTSLVAVPLLFLLYTFIQLGCFRSSLLEECAVGTDRISNGEPQYIYQVRQEIQMLVGTESGSSIVAKSKTKVYQSSVMCDGRLAIFYDSLACSTMQRSSCHWVCR